MNALDTSKGRAIAFFINWEQQNNNNNISKCEHARESNQSLLLLIALSKQFFSHYWSPKALSHIHTHACPYIQRWNGQTN